MKTYIHEYIRERVTGKGRQIVGVIVGTIFKEMIVIGWSKTNIQAGDVFDRTYAIELALGRAKGIVVTPELPLQMHNQMRRFQSRCLRFFKQASIMSTHGPYIYRA